MKLKENRITLFSFWSLLALGCVGSLLSAFSFFSIASFGSVLSIASYGSVLSINCYYGFLSYCDNTNSHVASRYRPPSTEDFDVRIERVVDVPLDSYTNITVFSKTNKTVVLKSIDKDIQWRVRSPFMGLFCWAGFIFIQTLRAFRQAALLGCFWVMPLYCFDCLN